MNVHTLGQLNSLQLARVTDNADPDQRGRIKVQLQTAQVELWASVVAPSAGNNYGASFIPRNDEIVVVGFLNPDTPLVLGSIWCGNGSVPEDINAQEDQYVIRTPAGTVVEFDDNEGPKVEMRTRSGYRVTVTEENGGEVQIERGSQIVTLTSSSIDINSSGPVNINASQVSVSASMVQVDAGMSRFSGVVQADTVIATSVVGTTYTPGAGNIW
ncbi:VgrG protein [Hahella sp. CCB-MM4]|uniref:phage baseplate assembly protein V n=1 Tax=Hahella sp. (strain CCB-MM4) TaxID=1926491 RepID=UPI000B9C452C|nr:phage baseplate assembly protein V [Hahella sp. CCB-MM4]OZG70299.1 VgrG protein [Hahella sp. CCB-MM4]